MVAKYKYTLTKDYVYPGILKECDNFFGFSEKGNLLMKINQGCVTIKAGYSWDGCSPKLGKISKHWIGTPDGKKDQTKRASCIHDALYQFKKEIKGLTRLKADQIFRDELIKAGWKMWPLYYRAVRIFGIFYWN